jgi:hypothetical protein
MDQELVRLIRKYFGQDVQIEREFLGGVHITTTRGDQVDFCGGEFENFSGDAELYRSVILMCGELHGRMTVEGRPEHVLAAMAHGKELGVLVIPRGDDGGAWIVAVWCGFSAWLFTLMFGWMLIGFEHLFYAACGFGLAAFAIAYPSLKKDFYRKSVSYVQRYRDIFPDVHGPADRKASRERARERGLL